MELETILGELEASGARLLLVGDDIRLRAPAGHVPAPETIAELRRHKGELLAYLHRRKGAAAAPPTEPDDAGYHDRAQAALAKLCRPDYPAGMIPWLEKSHFELYDELTSRIPEEIGLAWAARAPLGEFDRILALLVETHRRACGLYEAALPYLRRAGRG